MTCRIAVVGCGSIGKRHLRNFHVLGQTDLIAVDARKDRCEEIGAELGIPSCGTLQGAVAKGARVVLIAVPNAFHDAVMREAFEANCHVFVEKPITACSRGLDDLLKLQEERGLIGLMASNWKFHPAFRQMKAWLDSGRIGRVLSARAVSGQYLPDWHPWEDYRQMYSAKRALGGGVLLDSHEFDYLTWLLGPVRTIACLAGKVSDLDIDTEDLASALLHFESGAIGHIQVDYLQRTYVRCYEISGSEGSIAWEYGSGTVGLFEACTRQWLRVEDPSGYQINDMYLDQARHFLACLDGSERPATPLRRGAEVLTLLEAAAQSSREARFVEVGS